MIENKDLEKAEKELKTFLEDHPELKEFQEEIDRSIESAKNPESRLLILMSKIIENNNRLIDIMNKVLEESR